MRNLILIFLHVMVTVCPDCTSRRCSFRHCGIGPPKASDPYSEPIPQTNAQPSDSGSLNRRLLLVFHKAEAPVSCSHRAQAVNAAEFPSCTCSETPHGDFSS